METLWQDIRIAVRTLRKTPGFTLVMVLVLGIGIGANAALFPFLHGILTNPLGFDEPDRLAYLDAYAPERNRDLSVSYPDFVEWQAGARSFESMMAFQATTVALSGDREPERVNAMLTSHTLSQVLGVLPIQGRTFLPEDDREGAPGVVLLGFGLWQLRFGGDSQVLGRTIIVDGEQVTVIGIMPRDFRFPANAELWMPLRLSPLRGRGNFGCQAVGRIASGVSLEGAQTELRAIAADLSERYAATNGDVSVRLSSLTDVYVAGTREPVVIFYVVVTLILLLACANAANLMIARGAGRRREIAIRGGLGACYLRIARMLLTEAILLALAGGALGFLLGWVGREMILDAVPVQIPYYVLFGMDAPVIFWLTGITVFCGLLLGLAPALQAARFRPSDCLQSSAGSSDGIGRSRLRSFLIASQVGLALVVLVGAGLSLKSLVELRSVDPGFLPENVLTVGVTLPEASYGDPEEAERFFRVLQERVKALPGVVTAAGVTHLPMGRSSWGTRYFVEGEELPPPGQYSTATHHVILPEYFETMGIPFLRGRGFNAGDRGTGSSPVVIVNRQFAEKHWPGEDPIGKRVRYYPEPREDDPWTEVVGVVEGIRHYGYKYGFFEEIYRPHGQYRTGYMSLAVKTSGNPLALARAVQDEVWNLDPDVPPHSVRSMEQVMREGNWQEPVFAWLFGVFSSIALVLAAVGLYGVVAYSVAQRSREFGIRLALGAEPRRLVGEVLRQGGLLTAAGLAGGLVLAFVGMRFAQRVFFGVSPWDPTVYGVTILAMTGAAFLASYLPAKRVTRLDPTQALRA